MRFPIVLLCLVPLAAAWSYQGANDWDDKYPTCNGSHQSPIEIISDDLVPMHLPELKFHSYDAIFGSPVLISNNGHNIEITVPTTTSGSKPFITGGPLKGNYTAESVIFHWGSLKSQGSEHVINGIQYAMEMQIIHKNSKYATTPKASKHMDGLAVIAVLFEYDIFPTVEAPGIDMVLDSLKDLVKYRASTTLFEDFTLDSLLGNVNEEPYITGDEFIAYRGSLTTPPCAEPVTWILFKNLIPIHPLSVYEFFNIQRKSRKRLVKTFRPVQPLGDRKVYWRVP